MKILHTISSLGAKSGGTSTCTYDLVKGLNAANCETNVLTLDISDPTDKIIGDDDFVHVLPNDAYTKYTYSRNFKQFLKIEDTYNLFHINGMWEYVNFITASIARKKRKPYVVTTHGMLYPQALIQNRLLKKFFMGFQFHRVLQNAACIHATCLDEMNHYRALGFTNPVAVIPNPIPIPEYVNEIKRSSNKKRIGFLGRLHPRKKIVELIYAWSNLGDKVNEAELYIIGKGDSGYEDFLMQEVNRLRLKNVVFVGFLNGRDKFEMLATFTALVVPSDFENFGMIVTEALMLKVPVIASKGTPWQELESNHCGWWVENDINTLALIIENVLLMNDSELELMGENGQKLVLEKYSVDRVSKKMIQLYEWLLNGGERPNFLYTL
jgi:glycosyltransferase involved in cell wall biosynthesis